MQPAQSATTYVSSSEDTPSGSSLEDRMPLSLSKEEAKVAILWTLVWRGISEVEENGAELMGG
jgi:hypothetical protein